MLTLIVPLGTTFGMLWLFQQIVSLEIENRRRIDARRLTEIFELVRNDPILRTEALSPGAFAFQEEVPRYAEILAPGNYIMVSVPGVVLHVSYYPHAAAA